MKLKIALLVASAIFSSLASAAPVSHAQFVAAKPEQRCEILAAFAADVAEFRDLGLPLSDVKEVNAERYRNNVLQAYNETAAIVYRNPGYTPAENALALKTGCLEGLKLYSTK